MELILPVRSPGIPKASAPGPRFRTSFAFNPLQLHPQHCHSSSRSNSRLDRRTIFPTNVLVSQHAIWKGRTSRSAHQKQRGSRVTRWWLNRIGRERPQPFVDDLQGPGTQWEIQGLTSAAWPHSCIPAFQAWTSRRVRNLARLPIGKYQQPDLALALLPFGNPQESLRWRRCAPSSRRHSSPRPPPSLPQVHLVSAHQGFAQGR